MLIALTIIAAIVAAAIAVTMALRRTTISVIIRKDPDMDTIKQRLATLEADNAALKAQLAEHDAAIKTAANAAPSASAADLATLDDRVGAVEAEIGTDPVEAPAAPAPDALTDAGPSTFPPIA